MARVEQVDESKEIQLPSLIIDSNQKSNESITQQENQHEMTTRKMFNISPHIQGRFLALFGALFTALNLTAIQYMYKTNFPPPQALITRYTPPLIFVIIIGSFIKLMNSQSDNKYYFFARDKSAFKTLSIRALLHWSSNMCTIYALLYVPVMISISLFYIWSIFAIFLSHVLLKEKTNVADIILSLVSFGGVIMISNPTFESFNNLVSSHVKGIILTIISALLYALNMVILRMKRNTYHWTHTESVAGLWVTFVFTPIYILVSYYLFDIPMTELFTFDLTIIEWIIFAAISISAFCAIGGITRALQLETVVIVSIVLYSEVAFGTIFQFVLLKDTTHFNTYGLWIGIVCVLGSTLSILHRNEKQQKQQKQQMDMNDHEDVLPNAECNSENQLKVSNP